MNDSFMYVALAVLSVLIVIGIITVIIMKKTKVNGDVVAVTGLITTFFGLLAAGALVFIVSIGMMKDYVAIRRYAEPVYVTDLKDRFFYAKEYANDKSSGFEVYIKGSGDKIGDVETDGYFPFTQKEYRAEWDGAVVTVYFTYKNDDEGYQSKYVVIDTDKATVSDSMDSDEDLRKEKESSENEQESAA